MGTMAQGFAFGTGSSIARGAVGAAGDALFGGSASDQAAQPAAPTLKATPKPEEVRIEFDVPKDGETHAAVHLHEAGGATRQLLKKCEQLHKTQKPGLYGDKRPAPKKSATALEVERRDGKMALDRLRSLARSAADGGEARGASSA